MRVELNVGNKYDLIIHNILQDRPTYILYNTQ